MSDCRLSGRLDAFYDGELSPEEARLVQAHLAQCPSCADSLHARRQVSALLQENLAPPPLSAATRDRIRAAALSGLREAAIARLARGMTAIAASLLAAALAWTLFVHSNNLASAAPSDWELAAAAPAQAAHDDPAPLARWIVHDLSKEPRHE